MEADRTDRRQLWARLAELEETVGGIQRILVAFEDEIRTRQLVVVDDEDHPRIVGEVFADVAELRLELPTIDGEAGPELLLFAVESSHPGPDNLGPAVGLQLRAKGRAILEIDAWPEADGVWRPHLHLSGP